MYHRTVDAAPAPRYAAASVVASQGSVTIGVMTDPQGADPANGAMSIGTAPGRG